MKIIKRVILINLLILNTLFSQKMGPFYEHEKNNELFKNNNTALGNQPWINPSKSKPMLKDSISFERSDTDDKLIEAIEKHLDTNLDNQSFCMAIIFRNFKNPEILSFENLSTLIPEKAFNDLMVVKKKPEETMSVFKLFQKIKNGTIRCDLNLDSLINQKVFWTHKLESFTYHCAYACY